MRNTLKKTTSQSSVQNEVQELKSIVAQRIKEGREVNNITQKKLSEQAGISIDGIKKIENGRMNFSIEYLYKICKALKIPISEILK